VIVINYYFFELHQILKIEDEKILGNWLAAQQSNYKKNEYIMKDEAIKKRYEEFIENYK
jgi:hypothetical protein